MNSAKDLQNKSLDKIEEHSVEWGYTGTFFISHTPKNLKFLKKYIFND